MNLSLMRHGKGSWQKNRMHRSTVALVDKSFDQMKRAYEGERDKELAADISTMNRSDGGRLVRSF
jgi:phosphohistidine phosphatase SixA